MQRSVSIVRWPIGLTPLLVISLSGCAVRNALPAGPAKHKPATLLPGVDASRANLPLDRIEPVVSPPAKPASIDHLSKRAAAQIAKARTFIDQQRFTEAALELERALRYQPDHPAIHRALAILHWKAGNLERARIHAERTIQRNPADGQAHFLLGRCLSAAGDQAGAIFAYRTALLCPDFASDPSTLALCRFLLADVLAQEGYLQASLLQYETFATLVDGGDHPSEESDLATLLQTDRRSVAKRKAAILEKLGRFGQAADALAGLTASTKDVSLRLRRARLLLRAGRKEEALAAVRAIDSNDAAVIDLLSRIHEAAGHRELVVDDLRARLALQPEDPKLVQGLADVLVRLGRVSEAEQVLQSFLKAQTGSAAEVVRAKLVDVLIAQSAWPRVLVTYGEAVRENPNRAAALEKKILPLASNEKAVQMFLGPPAPDEPAGVTYLRGLLAMKAGHMEQAVELLRASSSRDRSFVPVRVALANAYIRLYRYDEAIQTAARTDEAIAQDSRLEMALGRAYERLDQREEAERHWKAAVQLDRSHTDAMFALALLYHRTGRTLKAQRQLRALLDQNPHHDAAREKLAEIYLATDKTDAAIEEYKELRRVTTNPTIKARCQALLDHFPNLKTPAYRNALLASIEQNGPDYATWMSVADSYAGTGKPQSRREAYAKALALKPDSEKAVLRLVSMDQRLLDFESSVKRLRGLLPRRPHHHKWRLALIDSYWIVQDYESALKLAQDELAREDQDETARLRYRLAVIDSLRFLDRSDEAVARIKKWSAAQPDDHSWPMRSAEIYRRAGKADQAVKIYEALHEADPTNPNVVDAMIDALIEAKQYDRACQYILDRLVEDPENDNVASKLVLALAAAERFDEAIDLARHTMLHTQNREYFQDAVLRVLALARRLEERLDYVNILLDEVMKLGRIVGNGRGQPAPFVRSERQRALQPDDPINAARLQGRLAELRLRLASANIDAGSFQEAEQSLKAWFSETDNPRIRVAYLRQLAFAYQMQADEVRSTEALEQALLLRTKDVGLQNDVAYGLIDQGIRLDEAEEMIRFALWRAPRLGAYLDTFGWLLYKKGEFAPSKKWLSRANRNRSGNDPVVLDHLGDACWRLGEREEALTHWTKAVSAIKKLTEAALRAADVRRVRDTTQGKIDAARRDGKPKVAELAKAREAVKPAEDAKQSKQ